MSYKATLAPAVEDIDWPQITQAQAEQMKGLKCLVLSHHSFTTCGMGALALNWVEWYTVFMQKYAVEIHLASPKMPEGERSVVEEQQQEREWYDNLITVDGWDDDDMALNIANAVKETGIKMDGVFTHTENLQTVLGQVCEYLGIKQNPALAFQKARDKYKTREALHEAGLAAPKMALLSKREDITEIMAKIDYPVIIKPVSGAGSKGVYKAFDEAELYESVDRALEEVGGTGEAVLTYTPGVTSDAPIMIEELLIAKDFEGLPIGEFDIDIVVWDNECTYARVTDNWKPTPPYFLENGCNSPSVTSEAVQRELIDYCMKVIKALGFFKGVFHTECMYTESHGPVLLECNPRVGGGPIRYFNNQLYGVELLAEFLMTNMNVPVKPIVKNSGEGAVTYFLCCPKTGKLLDGNYMDKVAASPGVKSATAWLKGGEMVMGYDTQVPIWIGEIVMHCPVDEIKDCVRRMEEMAALATESVNVDLTPEDEVVVEPTRNRSSIMVRRSSAMIMPYQIDEEQMPGLGDG
ncbi:hypothetical protein SARC_04972 [Sphaeroforma arctica JP610]|uniref:ATP-grasp domain-containing protein n=1 Tax=Sphaeroforma arctica JP610 TaxID=667725 RepID=A0A0L0G0Y2_9EUKA|nr:hypothetical protein SARC_04972 [Sphaeroforma arctica JP610]KNC82730.1 hypothetical protein SARC_04972 [Sphaeroforma arctica JP610]|eukprot:XP_014156632.1 hypothetical protein SARC_04972 [Sphaeroforma arctica JP610]